METKPQTYPIVPKGVSKYYYSNDGNSEVLVCASSEALEKDQKEIKEAVDKHRLIQTIVGISALEESIITILMIGKAYKSILSISDDTLVIKRFDWAIDQCKQAREEQIPQGISKTVLLINVTTSDFQIFMNELFEHFITLLKHCKSFITGKSSNSYSTVETLSQKWGWVGWQQISAAALMPLFTIKKIIKVYEEDFSRFTESEKTKKYIEKLKKIVQAFEKIIESFLEKKYPTLETIKSIFPKDDFINSDIIKKFSIDQEETSEKPNDRFSFVTKYWKTK